MMTTIFSFILALLGLGFLILIHELGHYWVARACKMKVESFSIGFGPSLFEWEKDGVTWKVGLFLFGGYVCIAGMDHSQDAAAGTPGAVGNFYSHSPWQRLAVAVAGPAANILFAFVALSILWAAGGRERPLSYYTHVLGWTNNLPTKWAEKPELADYLQIGPGDQLTHIAGKQYEGYEDLLLTTVLPKERPLTLEFEKVDYFKGTETPLNLTFDFKDSSEKLSFPQLFIPAQVLFIQENHSDFPLQKGERLLWIDGKILFSSQQISYLVNQPTNLVTIQRGNQKQLVRLLKYRIDELALTQSQRLDWEDVAFAAGMGGTSVQVGQKWALPFILSSHLHVTGQVETVKKQIPPARFVDTLQNGDKILAIDGIAIESQDELFKNLQSKKIFLVAESAAPASAAVDQADEIFFHKNVNWSDLQALIQGIGLQALPSEGLPKGNLRLLGGISAMSRTEFLTKTGQKVPFISQAGQPQMLGISFRSATVTVNPPPLTAMHQIWSQVRFNLLALFRGDVGVGQMMGPVGITAAVSQSLDQGFSEALWWLSLISLNLAILNLLPIPVLDGGMVCFSLWEIITRKPIRAKTAERLIIPFAIFLAGLFIYVTIHDLLRLFFST